MDERRQGVPFLDVRVFFLRCHCVSRFLHNSDFFDRKFKVKSKQCEGEGGGREGFIKLIF